MLRTILHPIFCPVILCLITCCAAAQQKTLPPVLTSLAAHPDAEKWTRTDSVALKFPTFHTQGLLKVGDDFYLSAVEVKQWPKKYGENRNGFDRDTGVGTGHLFKFNAKGELLADLLLGEGSVYHPGGIDFDGQFIWVPVCEYRPYGRAILYRVDPRNMSAQKIDTCSDAIGAVCWNRDTHELIGMNWDGEKFYKWKWNTTTARLQLTGVEKNHHNFLRYQDCKYIGGQLMLCSGLRGYKNAAFPKPFSLGGLQVIDLRNYSAVFEIPVPLWTSTGASMNNNPFFSEQNAEGLWMYFVPEDNHSRMYIYKAE